MEPDKLAGKRWQDESSQDSCGNPERDAVGQWPGISEGDLADKRSKSCAEKCRQNKFSKGFFPERCVEKYTPHDGKAVIEILAKESETANGEYGSNERPAHGCFAFFCHNDR